ncbi:MAG: glycosyl hydrolase, partial [Bacteroidota bacterium]
MVYAVYTDAIGNTLGTFRTVDGGDTWTQVSNAETVSYGWWFGQIRVDPTDWRRVWVPWLNLYRSTTSGNSWQYRSDNMHVDHHALWIDPSDPSRMIAGNDGGVYRSTLGGDVWVKASGAFPATQFYTVEVDASEPQRLYGGTQDNGTNRTLTGNLNDWQPIFGGDGHYVLVDPIDNDYVYVEFQYGNLYRSQDGGNTFVFAQPPVARANWSAPMAFDPQNPRTVYFGGERIFRTRNRMLTWDPISPDLSNGPGSGSLVFGTVTTIGVSPAASSRLWAGTDDGKVWTTADAGGTWTDRSAGLPDRWVTRITPHPTEPLAAVATLSGFRWGENTAQVYRT